MWTLLSINRGNLGYRRQRFPSEAMPWRPARSRAEQRGTRSWPSAPPRAERREHVFGGSNGRINLSKKRHLLRRWLNSGKRWLKDGGKLSKSKGGIRWLKRGLRLLKGGGRPNKGGGGLIKGSGRLFNGVGRPIRGGQTPAPRDTRSSEPLISTRGQESLSNTVERINSYKEEMSLKAKVMRAVHDVNMAYIKALK